MRCRLLSVRRIAALSAAIALFTSPIAAAQTPVPAPAGDPPAPLLVLNSAAFARLVKMTPTDAGSVPEVRDVRDVRDVKAPPRLDGLPGSPTAEARLAKSSASKAPRRGLSGGQKVLGVLVFVGILAGALVVSYYTGVDSDQILEGIYQWASK